VLRTIITKAGPIFFPLIGQVKEVVKNQPAYTKGNQAHAAVLSMLLIMVLGPVALMYVEYMVREPLRKILDIQRELATRRKDGQLGAVTMLIHIVLLVNDNTYLIEAIFEIYRKSLPPK
jgi:hypothetical protein